MFRKLNESKIKPESTNDGRGLLLCKFFKGGHIYQERSSYPAYAETTVNQNSEIYVQMLQILICLKKGYIHFSLGTL